MAVRTYYVALGVVTAFLVYVMLSNSPWMKPDDFKSELVKVGIQVVVFGIAGGIVKHLLDRDAEYRKFRADMLERLGRAHKDVYRVRRLLSVCRAEEKPALLGELMNVRQDLGTVYHVARVWGMGSALDQVRGEIKAMRAYLEAVTDGALSAEGSRERALYDDFLNWQRENGRYNSDFKGRYKKAKMLVDPSFKAQDDG